MPQSHVLEDVVCDGALMQNGGACRLDFTTLQGESVTVTMDRAEFDRCLARLNRLSSRNPRHTADSGRWDYADLE